MLPVRCVCLVLVALRLSLLPTASQTCCDAGAQQVGMVLVTNGASLLVLCGGDTIRYFPLRVAEKVLFIGKAVQLLRHPVERARVSQQGTRCVSFREIVALVVVVRVGWLVGWLVGLLIVMFQCWSRHHSSCVTLLCACGGALLSMLDVPRPRRSQPLSCRTPTPQDSCRRCVS